MPLIGLNKIKKMTDKEYVRLNNELRGYYFSAFSEIIKGTPVDTGRARNNWFLSVESPSDSVRGKGNQSSKELDKMPVGVLNKSVFFTNNLPYIEKLEYVGHSDQAKNGWVRAILIKLANKIRNS